MVFVVQTKHSIFSFAAVIMIRVMTTLRIALKETKYNKVLTKMTEDQYSRVWLEQGRIIITIIIIIS